MLGQVLKSATITQVSSSVLNPELSVVIPRVGELEIFRQCLQGFASQNFPKEQFEIVVCEDVFGSPVLVVAKEFEGKLSIRYWYQTDAGVSVAKNYAVLNSNAPVIVFHDGSNIPAGDHLQRCNEFHKANTDENTVLLSRITPHQSLAQLPIVQWMFDPANGVIGFPQPNVFHNFWMFFGGCSSCKKSIFKFGLHDPAYRNSCEDAEVAFRINQSLELKVFYDPSVVSYFARPVKLKWLLFRSYLEGRAWRQLFEEHGEKVRAGINAGAFTSVEYLKAIEGDVPRIFGTLARLEPFGVEVPKNYYFDIANQSFDGTAVLWVCYSLAVRYARSLGWVEYEMKKDEKEGLAMLEERVNKHYVESPLGT